MTPLFHFPFAATAAGVPYSEQETNVSKVIINGGDVESGVLITLHANGPVSNPVLYNVDTRESLGLALTMQDGDTVNRLVRGSSWFQIASGENTFTYTVADDLTANLTVTFQHTDKYEGV